MTILFKVVIDYKDPETGEGLHEDFQDFYETEEEAKEEAAEVFGLNAVVSVTKIESSDGD